MLFKKLIERNVPAIVVRALIFCYEEQVAWVKWGNTNSEEFSVTNGTRQGAVMSPPLFSVYLDDLFKLLRKLGVGCHIAGLWMGATGYADDMLLLAPTRSAMQAMLLVCEKYALDHNISFSVDVNPQKSKTKCLYICGNMTNRKYPAPLKLNGRDLPFVLSCIHLGHELAQDGTMATDAKIRRARYIDKSIDIRDMFRFAHPAQVIGALEKYCDDHYGLMLWDLFDDYAGKYFRCWNTAIKLSWDCPRATHTYFVTHLLGCGIPSIREKILTRYVKFFKSLLKSKSPEVALVANLVRNDRSSVTGANLEKISQETGIMSLTATTCQIMEALAPPEPPQNEMWRFPLLEKYLYQRSEMVTEGVDTKEIDSLIDALCAT